MDLLDDYIHKNTLTVKRILEEVDEWVLYCYYLDIPNLTTRKTYKSPIKHKDDHPSFSIFEASKSKDVEYLWKDSALNKSGNIFDLLILTIDGVNSKEDALRLIASDFEIGVSTFLESKSKVFKIDRPNKEETNIRTKNVWDSKGLDYWSNLGIDSKQLTRYNTNQASFIWYTSNQEHPYRVSELTFSYLEWDAVDKRWRTQLYSPFVSKELKFRSDYNDNICMGFFQLRYDSDTLIITKSKKDLILLDSLGYNVISPRSETTMIPEKFMTYLLSRYKRVIVWLDPDAAGWSGMYKYKELYPTVELVTIYPCLLLGKKDIADYRLVSSKEETLKLVKLLVNGLD